MTEPDPLTREDALILLDELERVLPALQSGDADEETAKQVPRLVQGLRRLPLPPDRLEERVKEIQAWSELLLSGRPAEEQAGIGSVATRLEERLRDLRRMIESDT